MGGRGRNTRHSRKAVADGLYSIDTANMKRWGLLVPGTTNREGVFQWRRGNDPEPASSVAYLLTVARDTGVLRLLYSIKAADAKLDYTARLTTTACHMGGARWWLHCPLARNGVACGRRVRKLHLRGNYFGCRQCHNLTYRSCQASDSRVYAALRRGEHLRGAEDVQKMSLGQLSFALKVLTAGQKRLDRLGKRLDRGRGKRGDDV